jgi:hypothetical protein
MLQKFQEISAQNLVTPHISMNNIIVINWQNIIYKGILKYYLQ